MKATKGLQKRATKAGIRAVKRNGGALSKDELLKTKVQIVPAWGRVTMLLVGGVMLGCGISAWPSDNGAIQVLLVVVGFVLLFGGVFGLKQTLSKIVDAVDVGSGGVVLLELVVEGVGGVIGAVFDS